MPVTCTYSHMFNNSDKNKLSMFKFALINSLMNQLRHLLCKYKIGNITNECHGNATLDTVSGATPLIKD